MGQAINLTMTRGNRHTFLYLTLILFFSLLLPPAGAGNVLSA